MDRMERVTNRVLFTVHTVIIATNYDAPNSY